MVQNGCEPFELKPMLEICKESSDFLAIFVRCSLPFICFLISFYNQEAAESLVSAKSCRIQKKV